jgi:hypothetical protein
MAEFPILLSWTKYVPVSEGQDPLGLNLRVNARLASQLFYCITSITPRARYYSFIAWAVSVAKGMSQAPPLRDRLKTIEKAYAMSCVAHHNGTACTDGRLVGIDQISLWHKDAGKGRTSIKAVPFAKIPALNAYWASLVNLGLMKAQNGAQEADSEEEAKHVHVAEVDLSEAGNDLAAAYGKALAEADPTGDLKTDQLDLNHLAMWGRQGCLCSLRDGAPDQTILRDLFFNHPQTYIDSDEFRSHKYRKHTLLLLMQLADQFSDAQTAIDETSFGDAVYFGHIWDHKDRSVHIKLSPLLEDSVRRWSMFYAHYYLSAALENLFVCTMVEANLKSLEGFTLDEFVGSLAGKAFNGRLRSDLGIDYDGPFTEITLNQFYEATGLPKLEFSSKGSHAFDQAVRLDHILSESRLLQRLRDKAIWGTPDAMAYSILLIFAAMIRFIKEEGDTYGNWLANASVQDPHGNVTVPVVLKQIRAAFASPLDTPIKDLLVYVLDHFVVRLHQELAYQKSGSFLYTDEGRIIGRKRYEKPGYGNGRLPSAILILKDLGLLAAHKDNEMLTQLTDEGRKWLQAQLDEMEAL